MPKATKYAIQVSLTDLAKDEIGDWLLLLEEQYGFNDTDLKLQCAAFRQALIEAIELPAGVDVKDLLELDGMTIDELKTGYWDSYGYDL